MNLKCDDWPLVLSDDHGIRPNGQPDECFYCRRKVGQPHSLDCVMVRSLVEYEVLNGDGVVGIYRCFDPFGWGPENCEFHKNDSSWCSDSAVDETEWTDQETGNRARRMRDGDEQCTCHMLSFRFVRVVDQGPFVTRPDK